MGFSFPVTPDRSGEILGSALGNIVNDYYGAREKSHQMHAQALQDAIAQADAAYRGVRKGKAPPEPPAEPLGGTAAAGPTLPSGADYLAAQPRGVGLADALGAEFQKVNAMNAPAPGAFAPGQGGMPGQFHSPSLDGPHPAAAGAPGGPGAGGPAPGGPGAGGPGAGASPLVSGYLAQQRPVERPLAAPDLTPPPEQSPADRVAASLNAGPRYSQLTPGYYMDYGAPGVQAQRLAAALGLQKTQAETTVDLARANWFNQGGRYGMQGGRRGFAPVPTANGLWDPNKNDYVRDPQGNPVMPRATTTGQRFLKTSQGFYDTQTGTFLKASGASGAPGAPGAPGGGSPVMPFAAPHLGTTPAERETTRRIQAAQKQATAEEQQGRTWQAASVNPNLVAVDSTKAAAASDSAQTHFATARQWHQLADSLAGARLGPGGSPAPATPNAAGPTRSFFDQTSPFAGFNTPPAPQGKPPAGKPPTGTPPPPPAPSKAFIDSMYTKAIANKIPKAQADARRAQLYRQYGYQ